MAIHDNPSIKLARIRLDVPTHTRLTTATEVVEPEIRKKWHPRTTLLFVLLSSGLLWAGILGLVFYLT